MEPLDLVAREIEQHVAAGGWDQPARLFALVPTAELLDREPHLAALLGVDGSLAATPWTPVEQEGLPDSAGVEELLAGIAWPDGVAGAALAVERTMLPPDAEADLPPDPDEALAVLAAHPGREDVRLVVTVTREGARACALRMRSHDEDASVLGGADLVPTLADALEQTLQD